MAAERENIPAMKRLVVFCFVLVAACAGARSLRAQVTYERIRNAAQEPQNWLTYSGSYSGQRHSGLDQIDTGNVKSLVPKWVFQSGALGKWETTPLLVPGILYGPSPAYRSLPLDSITD